MDTAHRIHCLAIGMFAACAASALCIAGAPGPPAGPVGSTMKTLEEIEPRIALTQDNTPGDAGSEFIIDTPGSYYLTADTTVTGKHGIRIISSTAGNVAIDLMGYTLRGDGSSGHDGILSDGTFETLIVRNGVITGWDDGIDRTTTSGAARVEFSSLIVSNNLNRGIAANDNSIIRDCVVANNGSHGIIAAAGSIITDCTSYLNDGRGISANLTCLITNCNVSFNGDSGIYALEGSIVRDCISRANSPAIQVTDDCRVTNNNCDSSGTGILVTGSSSRIDSNQVSDCTTGIEVNGDGNLIIRNSVAGGTTKYDIVANNKVGTIVSAPNSGPISGSSGGVGVGSTDPWANISY